MNRVRQQIRSMLKVETREAGFRATLRMAPDFMLLPDHFAGAPVVPGICLIQAVLLAGEDWQRTRLRLCEVKRAKFMAPTPLDRDVVIEAKAARAEDGAITIQAVFLADDKKFTQISLIARAASPATGLGQ